MSPDAELIHFLDLPESGVTTCTPEAEGEGQEEATRSRLKTAFLRNLPWIRHYVHSAHRAEWSFGEYLERLYRRLKRRAGTIEDFDQAIEYGMKSLVHEDLRNQERRWKRASSIYFGQANAKTDPNGLRFVTVLASQDRLKEFTNLLDRWTAAAFVEIHLEDEDVPRQVIADRFGMTEGAFNKRYQRGIALAREKYLRIYGYPKCHNDMA